MQGNRAQKWESNRCQKLGLDLLTQQDTHPLTGIKNPWFSAVFRWVEMRIGFPSPAPAHPSQTAPESL